MGQSNRVHFIGFSTIGHADLAAVLAKTGFTVSGSAESLTDEIRSKLLKANLLPSSLGWSPDLITQELASVVIGPDLAQQNEELAKARRLNIPIYSLPDFIYNQSLNKQRIVVAGTSGKAVIVHLVLHVLSHHKRKYDYVTAVPPQGKDSTISLSTAPLIIIEGQEVKASPFDSSLSYLRYHQHMGVISDIEWAETNGAGRDAYYRSFSEFESLLPKSGVLIYNEKDPVITGLLKLNQPDVLYVPYAAHPSVRENGQDYLTTNKEYFPVKVPGANALLNIHAAKEILKKTGITSAMFYQAIRSFQPNLR